MGWITHTWRAALDGARTWGREAAGEWRDTVREITGRADADRWYAERAGQTAADPTWLARDGGRVVEVDADGYPDREASPDDGRPVAEAEDQADADYRRWVLEGEKGNPPASAALDREIDAALEQYPDGPTWAEQAQAKEYAAAQERGPNMSYPEFEGPGFTEPPVDWPGWHQDHTEGEKDHYWDHLGPDSGFWDRRDPVTAEPLDPGWPEMDPEPSKRDVQAEAEPS